MKKLSVVWFIASIMGVILCVNVNGLNLLMMANFVMALRSLSKHNPEYINK